MDGEEGGSKRVLCNTNIFFAPLAGCILKNFSLSLSISGRYISDGVLFRKLGGVTLVWSLEVKEGEGRKIGELRK